MENLVKTLNFLFGCHHSNLSRVFTLHGRTYQVCCSCGAEFDYSLERLCTEHRVLRRRMFRRQGLRTASQ